LHSMQRRPESEQHKTTQQNISHSQGIHLFFRPFSKYHHCYFSILLLPVSVSL